MVLSGAGNLWFDRFRRTRFATSFVATPSFHHDGRRSGRDVLLDDRIWTVLWSRLRIWRLRIRLLGIWRLRILRNRALDVLAGTVLARSWLLLSVGGLWFWMFRWMRLSTFTVRLRTLRGREMRLAVRLVLWPVLL
jgi:hypothetical protein